jgi:hypothetical protein
MKQMVNKGATEGTDDKRKKNKRCAHYDHLCSWWMLDRRHYGVTFAKFCFDSSIPLNGRLSL